MRQNLSPYLVTGSYNTWDVCARRVYSGLFQVWSVPGDEKRRHFSCSGTTAYIPQPAANVATSGDFCRRRQKSPLVSKSRTLGDECAAHSATTGDFCRRLSHTWPLYLAVPVPCGGLILIFSLQTLLMKRHFRRYSRDTNAMVLPSFLTLRNCTFNSRREYFRVEFY
jgi:hypothetical protein